MFRVQAARAGRAVFGLMLTVGGIALFARGWSGADHIHARDLLAASWAAAVALGVIAYLAGRMWPRPVSLATSLVLPSIGISLVLPLTLHYLVGCAVGGWHGDFDEWVSVGTRIAILPHVALVLLAVMRARVLAAGRVPTSRDVTSIGAIFGIVCGVAAIPFVVPTVFTAITGLPFIPLFYYSARIAAREHAVDAVLPAAHVVTS